MEVTNEQHRESDVLTKVLSTDIEKIGKTIEEISKEEFEAAMGGKKYVCPITDEVAKPFEK